MEIDHEIISTVIILPSADSRRVVVSFKRKYVHKGLVNHLVKLAEEKSVARWTDRRDMTIAVDWDVKQQTKTIMKSTCTVEAEEHKNHKSGLFYFEVYVPFDRLLCNLKTIP